MGQRTVAKLVKCPLPSRCFTEQRPRPLVGQPPPAVGASIELGRNDVGQTRGHKERTSAAAGQVTGEEPCRRRVPHDDLPVAALAADRRTFTAYIEIFDVQGEDLAGPRGRGFSGGTTGPSRAYALPVPAGYTALSASIENPGWRERIPH